MGKRLNPPHERLGAKYVAFRKRRVGRDFDRTPVSPPVGSQDDLPFACPSCGDRSVVLTDCDRCGVPMLRETSEPSSGS